MYSKTSNNGPSEKRTTSLQRTAYLLPIDFTIDTFRTSEKRTPLNSEQRTHDQALTYVPWPISENGQ